MATGFVSYMNTKGYYGFIDSPELAIDHIFFHTINCDKSYTHLYKGDKVSFDLDADGPKGNQAINISFLQNASLDGLRKDFEKGTILKGFLKKINDKYYVKDCDTYILIRLVIAKYEMNTEEVYEENINKLIDYKIIALTDKNKILAVNVNRQFSPASKLLLEGNATVGTVIGAVKGGYTVKVYDNVIGFLPNSFVLKSKRELVDGESVEVTCVQVNDDGRSGVFDLTENINHDEHLIFERAEFISSLVPGREILGTIRSVQGFGIFINIGLCEGLLHTSQFVADYADLSKRTKKELQKILQQVFIKGREIEVIVQESNEGRIGFSWHCDSNINSPYYAEFLQKYQLWNRENMAGV